MIDWLMLPTADGATRLCGVLLMIAFCVFAWYMLRSCYAYALESESTGESESGALAGETRKGGGNSER